MIKEAIEKLMQAENLTYDQVKESVDEIMTGQASPGLMRLLPHCPVHQGRNGRRNRRGRRVHALQGAAPGQRR